MTEQQRSQTALSAKTLRATDLPAGAFVGSAITARFGGNGDTLIDDVILRIVAVPESASIGISSGLALAASALSRLARRPSRSRRL